MDDERAARQVKRVTQALARPRSCHVCSARESKNSISPVTQRQSTVVCVRSGSPTKTRIRTRLAVRYAGTKRSIPDPCLQPRLHPPTAALVVVRQVFTGCLFAKVSDVRVSISSITFLPSPHSSRFFRAVALRAVHVSCCDKSLLTSHLQILPFCQARSPHLTVS